MSNIIDFNTEDVSCTILDHSKPTYNNAQEQEVNDLMEILKLEQTKYLQYKIIYDLIEDLISEDSIETKLKTKIKDIILSENLKQTTSFDTISNAGNVNMLGVENQNLVLTYSESSLLQEMLKIKLSENSENLATTHEDWTELVETTNELNPIQMTADDKVLLEFKNKLNVEQEKYMKNLLNLHQLLEELTKIRTVNLPEILEEKFKECQLEQKINHIKCTLAQDKFKVDIFTETNCSLKAYKELVKEIKEQQEDCQKEIEKLKDLKEKYKQIAGKQYDDILKPYIQCKASLEKKKILYSCLKS